MTQKLYCAALGALKPDLNGVTPAARSIAFLAHSNDEALGKAHHEWDRTFGALGYGGRVVAVHEIPQSLIDRCASGNGCGY